MSLRIGIVGAGENTRTRHIPGFQKIEGVEVVAVCNRSRVSGQKVADEFGIPAVHEDWKAPGLSMPMKFHFVLLLFLNQI